MEVLYNRLPRHSQNYTTRELGVPLEISVPIWQLHYITFGVIFSIMSVLILLSILGLLRDDREKKFQRRHYFLWMNLALFYFSLVMSIVLLADPFEDRRFIKPRIAREVLHFVVRLRLPCLTIAFSLVQLSLLNVTEVVLYATWFHNIVIIFIFNFIHLVLIVAASISSMCIANSMIVWLICDLCMFLLFVGNSIITLYSVVKIMLYYHSNHSKYFNGVSSNGYSHRSTFGDDDYITSKKIEAKPPEGEYNAAYITSEEEKHNLKVNAATDISVASKDNITLKQENIAVPAKHIEKKSSIRNTSLSPYVDQHKTVIQKRRIGSLPLKRRSSKFCDKSIRKVAILMMIVAMFGLVMCVTIVISLSSAKIFQGDHMGPWEWYALRTVRRVAEIGVTGTLAYMARRNVKCW